MFLEGKIRDLLKVNAEWHKNVFLLILVANIIHIRNRFQTLLTGDCSSSWAFIRVAVKYYCSYYSNAVSMMTVYNGKIAVIQKAKSAAFCRNKKRSLNTERLSCILKPTVPSCYKECRTVISTPNSERGL
jgi:hypothetical protein